MYEMNRHFVNVQQITKIEILFILIIFRHFSDKTLLKEWEPCRMLIKIVHDILSATKYTLKTLKVYRHSNMQVSCT